MYTQWQLKYQVQLLRKSRAKVLHDARENTQKTKVGGIGLAPYR
jgi:hypothetical protein